MFLYFKVFFYFDFELCNIIYSLHPINRLSNKNYGLKKDICILYTILKVQKERRLPFFYDYLGKQICNNKKNKKIEYSPVVFKFSPCYTTNG